MEDLNWVAITVAVLGSAGLGGVITSIFNGFSMARKGISGREDKRRTDIIQQRDIAWARAAAAEAEADAADRRADVERIKRIHWQEAAVRLRLQVILTGNDPVVDLPLEP